MVRKYAVGIIVCSVLGLFTFFYLFYTQTGFFPGKESYLELVITILTSNLIGFALYKVNLFLDEKISWRENSPLRLSIGIVSGFIIAGIMGLAIIGLMMVTTRNIDPAQLFSLHGEVIIKASIIVLCIILIYSIVYMTLFSFHEYSVVQIEKVKLHRKQLSLQFEALRNQLSPHYLFNCLNTISSLVYKDAELAENFIRRLAQTYLYVMSNNDSQVVSLKKEIEFVKSYYYLMKVRFDNSIDLNVNVPDDIQATFIPPLTLQILVENAIKHNAFTKGNPLTISIDSTHNEIIVSNNILEQPKNVTSFKVGLDNIKKRYDFFLPTEIKIKKDKEFKVVLPLIHREAIETKEVA